jgi:ATP-binding cassette subfamily B protein
MKKKDKRAGKERSFREEWHLFARALKIWKELLPGYFPCQFILTGLEVFTPYFGLYMSARLIDGLAGGLGIKQLLFLSGIAVFGGFILSVAGRFIRGKISVITAFMVEQHEEYIINQQNRLSYEHMENPDIVLLRSKIRNDFVSFGGGLNAVQWTFCNLLNGILDIIFSLSLTISMFAVTAQDKHTGFLGFVNSPYSTVLIVLMILLNTWLSIRISTTSTKKKQEALSELSVSNVRFGIYSCLWDTDMRVFDLHRIILKDIKKFQVHPAWVYKTEKIGIKYGIFSVLLDAVLSIAIFLFVAAKALLNVFGIGSFVLYEGTVGRFIRAVSGIASAVGQLRYNNNFLVEFYRYLDLPNAMYHGTLAVEKREDIDYEIEFKDVGFCYPRTQNWVLRHVNIKLNIGDKLAIVGENGSGKTTFIKLLCRLYDPTEGKILLNGIDITRYRYDEYLALFSVVFQDYSLFGFPLGENVAAGLSYDAVRARECLIRVGLGAKLAELEAGNINHTDAEKSEMDTNTEKGNIDALTMAVERNYDAEGIDFSGGELQKIALARALYKNAPFVVLDEPTAALDPLAEAEVYEMFNRVVEYKTSIFISHRLSSCRFCDKIAVFDHGQIVQHGSHKELVEDKDGKYYSLWRAQAQYYE